MCIVECLDEQGKRIKNIGTDQYAYRNVLCNKNQHLKSVKENGLVNKWFVNQF